MLIIATVITVTVGIVGMSAIDFMFDEVSR